MSEYEWVEVGPNRRVYRKKVQAKTGRGQGLQVRVEPDYGFASTSLPKNYAIHKERGGRFVDKPGDPMHGAVIIESRRQLEGLVREANGRGEKIAYDGPFTIYDD